MHYVIVLTRETRTIERSSKTLLQGLTQGNNDEKELPSYGSWLSQEPAGRKFDSAIPTVHSQDFGYQNPSSLNETLLFEGNY